MRTRDMPLPPAAVVPIDRRSAHSYSTLGRRRAHPKGSPRWVEGLPASPPPVACRPREVPHCRKSASSFSTISGWSDIAISSASADQLDPLLGQLLLEVSRRLY